MNKKELPLKSPNAILKITTILIVVWIVASRLLPCGSGNGIARYTQLRYDAMQLQGQALKIDALKNAVERLPLNIGTTHYTPDIQYDNATNWKVRLSPRPARAYSADLPFWNRLPTLNFSKYDYPIIEFSSANTSE